MRAGWRLPDVTVTMLDATPAQADPGRVTEANPTRPDPEVPERAHRRTFTARYKLDVLAAYAAADPGEKGAILRREGLYSSHVVDWRRARDAGVVPAAGPARPARRRPGLVASPRRGWGTGLPGARSRPSRRDPPHRRPPGRRACTSQ